ncbi:MAG: hypothetical protein H6744_01535 [Deltaproteobacteria bacterium]|nr:hypothetical protein [Deltaproteobacteria bacterium]
MGAALLAVGLLALSASEGLGRPPRVDRAHDGFFARLAVGGGWQRLLAPERTQDLRVKGATLTFEGSVGLSVERHLILHLTTHYWQMLGADFSTDGRGSMGGKAGSIAIGPGLSYYFMPVNIYLSGAIALGFMFMERPEGLGLVRAPKRSFRSDGGWVLLISAGKEFWVSGEWAVGLQAYFTLSNFPEPANVPVWAGPGFGLRLTATFD